MMDVKISLPLLPLRDIVIFPNMIAPLFVSLYLINFAYVYLFSAVICLITIGFTLMHPYILKTDAYK